MLCGARNPWFNNVNGTLQYQSDQWFGSDELVTSDWNVIHR